MILALLARRFTIESTATLSDSSATQCAGPVCEAIMIGSRCSRFAVREDREQVTGGVAVDADSEEVVDDEQVDVGELVQQLLVVDAISAGDD